MGVVSKNIVALVRLLFPGLARECSVSGYEIRVSSNGTTSMLAPDLLAICIAQCESSSTRGKAHD